MHARATIGACYTLAGKKAEAVKTRRKTLFHVAVSFNYISFEGAITL
jgi:hypothetical protein